MAKTFNEEAVTKFFTTLTPDVAGEAKKERTITEISKDRLLVFHTGEGHPFEVVDDEEMDELVESIRSNGILEPIIIRADKNFEGRYEIIAGHRRVHAAEKAGIDTLPCLVVDYDDDTAIKLMISSNLERREKIKPSTKAKAYRMYMEANKRQKGRPKNNGDQVGPNFRAVEKASEEFKESMTNIKRYLRLNELIPDLLRMVDDGELKFGTAVELSYLTEAQQAAVLDKIEQGYMPKLDEAASLRKLEDDEILFTIDNMGVKAKPKAQPKAKLNEKFINDYLPEQLRKKSVEQKRLYTQEALIRFNNYLEEHPDEQQKWMADKMVN